MLSKWSNKPLPAKCREWFGLVGNVACDVLAQAVSTFSLPLWGGAITFTGLMLTTARDSSVKSV